jgi:hypothetical protein
VPSGLKLAVKVVEPNRTEPNLVDPSLFCWRERLQLTGSA